MDKVADAIAAELPPGAPAYITPVSEVGARELVREAGPAPAEWQETLERLARRPVDGLDLYDPTEPSPEDLETHVRDAAAAVATRYGATADVHGMQRFRPGRPVPTHRVASTV